MMTHTGLPKDSGGWSKYQLFVVKKLERLEVASERQESETAKLRTEMAVLNAQFKIKSGVWGLLGGFIPAASVIAYMVLS